MANRPGDKSPRFPQRPRSFRWQALVWAAAILLFLLFLASTSNDASVDRLSYSQFKAAVQDGRVASVTLHGQELYGEFTTRRQAAKPGSGRGTSTADQGPASADERDSATASDPGPASVPSQGLSVTEQGEAARGRNAAGTDRPGRDFVTTRPQLDDMNLMSLLEKNDVDISVQAAQPEWWQRLLMTLLPWLVLGAVFIFFARRMRQRMGGDGQGGLFSLGRSRARRHRQDRTGVTMNEVAGSDNAKRDVQEIIDYLRSPHRYRRLGAGIPRGVLLVGPPGTGKTLLAKAVAGEANVPFYSIGGSEFIEMFVGVGASRVRDMFSNARKEAPAIIFIDELDAIGRSRGAGFSGGDNEREQTLNQILSEMDGFETTETVVVMAATNRPDVLDPALLRPGRFDRKVVVERPHREARLAILKVHVCGKPLADDVDLPLVARRTVGFSGADLGNLANEAALFAGREGKEEVDMACFDLARDKIMLGAPRDERLTDHDRKVVAYHECGHALLARLLPKAEPPDRVTIIPRGRALGVTEQNPAEERYNMSESDLRDRVGVMLGGRTAEKLMFGEVSTGAQQDLKQATDLVRKMVSEWGMSERLGATAFPSSQTQPFLGREIGQSSNFSERTAETMDAEIRRILEEIDDRVTRLLSEHRAGLDALARRLLEDETLGRRDIENALEQVAGVYSGAAAAHSGRGA